MGTLRIPAGGFVGIDTSVLIYTVEQRPEFVTLLRPLWEAVGKGSVTIVVSELVWLEALVGPIRDQDQLPIDHYDQLLAMPNIRPIAVSRSILRAAAHLRATLKIDTADSIHAATAMSIPCDTFVTNDADYQNIPGLSVQLLKDFVSS